MPIRPLSEPSLTPISLTPLLNHFNPSLTIFIDAHLNPSHYQPAALLSDPPRPPIQVCQFNPNDLEAGGSSGLGLWISKVRIRVK